MSGGAVTVRLEGDEELLAKLRALGLRVQDVLEPAVEAAAAIVRDGARSGAPGPHVEMETTEKNAQRVTVSVGPDKAHWYYRFFERGTAGHGPRRKRIMAWQDGGGMIVAHYVRGVAARPFLRPSMDSNTGAATAEMGATWRRTVEGV